jgi:hypothetical protein
LEPFRVSDAIGSATIGRVEDVDVKEGGSDVVEVTFDTLPVLRFLLLGVCGSAGTVNSWELESAASFVSPVCAFDDALDVVLRFPFEFVFECALDEDADAILLTVCVTASFPKEIRAERRSDMIFQYRRLSNIQYTKLQNAFLKKLFGGVGRCTSFHLLFCSLVRYDVDQRVQKGDDEGNALARAHDLI